MTDKTEPTTQPISAREFERSNYDYRAGARWIPKTDSWAISQPKPINNPQTFYEFAEAYADYCTAYLRQQKDEYRDRLADVATENFALRQQLAARDAEIARLRETLLCLMQSPRLSYTEVIAAGAALAKEGE